MYYMIYVPAIPCSFQKNFFPGIREAGGNMKPLTPGAIPPPCIYKYMLPLMGNTSIALSMSMIGMSGEIQFVLLIAYNNEHINCLSLLFEGKDLVPCVRIYMHCTMYIHTNIAISYIIPGNSLINV